MDIKEISKVQEHTMGISALTFDKKEKRLFSGSLDKTIKIWDLGINDQNSIETPELLSSIKAHEKWVTDLIFVEKNSMLLSSSLDNTIKIWNASSNTLNCETVLDRHLDYVQKILFLKKSERIVSTGFDCQIFIWDLNRLVPITFIDKYKSPIISLSCSKDESLLFAGSYDSIIVVWDLLNNVEKNIIRVQKGPINGLKVLKDQNMLIGIDNYGGFFGWELGTFQLLFSEKINEELNSLEVVQLKEKDIIILGGDSTLYIYMYPPLQMLIKIPAHNDKIGSLLSIQIDKNANTPIRYYLISGSLDKSVKIWEFKID